MNSEPQGHRRPLWQRLLIVLAPWIALPIIVASIGGIVAHHGIESEARWPNGGAPDSREDFRIWMSAPWWMWAGLAVAAAWLIWGVRQGIKDEDSP